MTSAYAAAAAIVDYDIQRPGAVQKRSVERLAMRPTPTNQRAEIEAVMLGIRTVFSRKITNKSNILILSDSKYAIDGMVRVDEWSKNGRRTARGTKVANRDLWERLIWHLDFYGQKCNSIQWQWQAREYNTEADMLCRVALLQFEKSLLQAELGPRSKPAGFLGPPIIFDTDSDSD